MQIKTILIGLVVGIIGYFLRDIYDFIKKKFIKGSSPKTSLKYFYKLGLTHDTNPRIYDFNSILKFKNIDIEPLYAIKILQKDSKNSFTILIEKEYLNLQEEIELKDKIEISYKSKGYYPKEAEEKLPDFFREPKLIVSFQNKDGHKFSKKLNL